MTGKGGSSSCKSGTGIADLSAHVYSRLGINATSNTSPLLLVPPPTPGLPLSIQESFTQLAFESLNVPGLSLLPSPLASLFALNATTGVVVHVGQTSCEIVAVTDSVVRWETATTVGVGMADCQQWLEGLLMEDESLDSQLRNLGGGKGGTEEWKTSTRRRDLVREVASVVFEECGGDDVEITPAGGKQAVAAVIAEEDDFDVAKK
jgi:actin-related protein 9